MLRELRVSGYRSLRQIALELSPLTVVVGANGTGKTNLYQALQLLASAAQGLAPASRQTIDEFPSDAGGTWRAAEPTTQADLHCAEDPKGANRLRSGAR